MEDDLKLGFKCRYLIAGVFLLAMGIFCFSIFLYIDKQENMPTSELYLFVSQTILLPIIEFLGIIGCYCGFFLGIPALIYGLCPTYRITREGIHTYYFNVFNFYTPWEVCPYIGIEGKLFPRMICLKSLNPRVPPQYAFRYPYSPERFEQLCRYAPHRKIDYELPDSPVSPADIPSGLSPTAEKATQVSPDTSEPFIVDDHTSTKGWGFVLFVLLPLLVVLMFLISQDWQVRLFTIGLWIISTALASVEYFFMNNKKFTIDHSGITAETCKPHQRRFYPWQQIHKVQVFSISDRYHTEFWIRYSGSHCFLLMPYTPSRYRRLQTYMPENVCQKPATHKFKQEWLMHHPPDKE